MQSIQGSWYGTRQNTLIQVYTNEFIKKTYSRTLTLFAFHTFRCITYSKEKTQARIQRGRRLGVRTPLRFARGWVLCRCLMSRRGGPTATVVFALIFFSLARFARQYYKKHITCIHTSKSNVQYGTVILFLYFPYRKYEKNQLPLPCFYERSFSIVRI